MSAPSARSSAFSITSHFIVSVGPSGFGILTAEDSIEASPNVLSAMVGPATLAEDPTVGAKPAAPENQSTQVPTTGEGNLRDTRTPSDATRAIAKAPDCRLARTHAAARRDVVAVTARAETRRAFAAFSDQAKVRRCRRDSFSLKLSSIISAIQRTCDGVRCTRKRV